MLINYFVYSTLFLLFSFFVFRVVVKNDYGKKLKLSPLSYSLEFLVFALHANLMYLFIPASWPDLPSLPENLTLVFISAALVFLGLVILMIAWFRLGSGTSFGQDKDMLETGGLYEYSRNPQLLGYGIMLLGLVPLYLSWYSLAWFIQYLIVSYFMIRSEEEFLGSKYGEEYEIYCSSVPRIIIK